MMYDIKVNGKKVIITINLDGVEGHVSSTGKSLVLENIQERVSIDGEKVKIGCNVYKAAVS